MRDDSGSQSKQDKEIARKAGALEQSIESIRQLIDVGNWSDVVQATRVLLDHNPTNGEAYHHQGVAMVQLGLHEEAESALRRAIYLDRTHVMSQYFLATLLNELGRVDEARHEFVAVVKKLTKREPNDKVSAESAVSVGELQAVISMWLDERAGGRP